MKSILVAISGTGSDIPVLNTAYVIAVARKAHLDFVHIPLVSIEMVDFNHHVEFARGSGLELALKEKRPRSQDAETKARAHVTEFCTSKDILQTSQPVQIDRVTASWIACPISPDIDGFMRVARAHDVTVIGRSAGKRNWSTNLLEILIAGSGRPVLIVPSDQTRFELQKAVVWWKDHSAAARALTAALPILGAAPEVAVISAQENDAEKAKSTDDVAKQLGWHGIEATAKMVDREHRATIDTLWSASLVGKADLIVMGGFSRSRLQEMIFGGCTQAVLENGVRPIFLLH